MALYVFGLVLAVLYLLFSLDDLIWDLFYSLSRLFKKTKHDSIRLKELDNELPRMLAVCVAAWHEEAVLYNVIDNLVASTSYPRSLYHVFLAVYPNDEGTLAVARRLESAHANVHVVVNKQAGPTCKADNLNSALRAIYEFEKLHGCRFAGVVVHDSEDVVHPYELRLHNHLLRTHSAVQIPVFPLQQMPRWGNLFRNMTAGTYADEFAENHMRTLVARNDTGAFVPSAGTGFSLSRELLESFGEEEVFPVGSLTEDYKLSLLLEQRGHKLHYVLEDLVRIRDDGSVAREFISTRSRFPSTFQLAVRQKTRWIYGITIQSFKLRDILKNKSLRFVSKYTLYKDWKAKFGNLIIAPGYAVFVYFLVSLFVDLPVIYPKGTFSWWLCVALTVLMFERQVLRFLAVKKAYGWKSALLSAFFPPLMPFRMVWGNLINMTATVKAWLQYVSLSPKASRRREAVKRPAKAPVWTKTDHEALDEKVLERFRRNLGDTLLEKKMVSRETLRDALAVSRASHERLGSVLLRSHAITEAQLLRALADVHHTQYLHLSAKMVSLRNIEKFPRRQLERLTAVPLFRTGDGWAFSLADESPREAVKTLESLTGSRVYVFYSTSFDIKAALRKKRDSELPQELLSQVERLVQQGRVSAEQAVLAWTHAWTNGVGIEKAFEALGLSA